MQKVGQKKSMSSSYMPWRSSATNRRQTQPTDNPRNPGPIFPDLGPAPSPKPIIRLLAFGLIIFLGLLQFLPASHFRHPSDPLRNWVPLNPHSSPSSTVSPIFSFSVLVLPVNNYKSRRFFLFPFFFFLSILSK